MVVSVLVIGLFLFPHTTDYDYGRDHDEDGNSRRREECTSLFLDSSLSWVIVSASVASRRYQ